MSDAETSEVRSLAMPAGTRPEREAWSTQSSTKFAEPTFIAQQVIPRVPELLNATAPPDWSAQVVRALSTGRLTVRYEFSGEAVYGKAYFDDKQGPLAYRLLWHLWQHGFDPSNLQRVPQPLGYVAEEKILLMRAAEGTPLDSLFVVAPIEQAKRGARAAARWLCKFHATEISFLPAELPCERIEIFKVASLLAKVAAGSPRKAPLLLELNHLFRDMAPSSNAPTKLVPLHGQFRPAHVFLEGDRVTVIDLDKIRLSDPAKDVARFIHVLKRSFFEDRGDVERAELLAREFESEYRVLAPDNLANLSYFCALYYFLAFAKAVKSRKLEEETRKSLELSYLGEFERCVQQDSRVAA
jgi:aminoglycoside phosphotransferase (APT) family kinase protein